MSKSTMSKEVQQQIAREGKIVGSIAAVRAVVQQILQDSRFRHISATYGPNKNPKPGKEPGTQYTVLACGGGPVKGVRSAEKSAAIVVDNDLVNVYCADAGRRTWRSIKVPLLTSIEVYTGRKVARNGKMVAERREVPIIVAR